MNRLASAETGFAEMQAIAKQVESLRGQMLSGKPKVAPEQLLSLLEGGLKSATIATSLKSITPESDGAIRMRFDEVPFDSLIQWLIQFHNQHGISVSSMSVVKAKSVGNVRANLLIN